jgi:thioredoxin-like negative regulator of GroEL
MFMSARISNEDIAPLLFDVLEAGRTHGDSTDLAAVLRLLRETRPKTLEIALLLAWELLKGLEYTEARELLEDMDFKHPGNARIKATLASVLFFTDVPLWIAYVAEVRSLPHDEEAVAIVNALELADDQRLPGDVALVGFQHPKALAEMVHQHSTQYV